MKANVIRNVNGIEFPLNMYWYYASNSYTEYVDTFLCPFIEEYDKKSSGVYNNIDLAAFKIINDYIYENIDKVEFGQLLMTLLDEYTIIICDNSRIFDSIKESELMPIQKEHDDITYKIITYLELFLEYINYADYWAWKTYE